MTVKVGDIVRYAGRNVRIMLIDGPLVRLSYFGLVNRIFNESDLVESVQLPTLTVGDKVIIHKISLDELHYYGAGWSSNMSCMLGEAFTVDNVKNSDICGPLVELDGWSFQTYHLEKVEDYDII